MNHIDILKLAKEAGFSEWFGTDDPEFLKVIERFARLVAAAELIHLIPLVEKHAATQLDNGQFLCLIADIYERAEELEND